MKARHVANTAWDLGRAVDELTDVVARNPWLLVPIRFVGCLVGGLVVAACWTVVGPDALHLPGGESSPAWAKDGVTSFRERALLAVSASASLVFGRAGLRKLVRAVKAGRGDP